MVKETTGPSLMAQRVILGGEPDISWWKERKRVFLYFWTAGLALIWDLFLRKMQECSLLYKQINLHEFWMHPVSRLSDSIHQLSQPASCRNWCTLQQCYSMLPFGMRRKNLDGINFANDWLLTTTVNCSS